MQGEHTHEASAAVYAAEAASVPRARRFAVETARKRGWEDTGALELLVSELVTNSANAASAFAVQVFSPYETSDGRFLRFEVADDNPQGPVLAPMTPWSESGRGIPLVDLLSAEWHWQERGSGKFVCVTLREERTDERPRRGPRALLPASVA
ncbi:ATP-binding protein [Saccharothrix sp. ST-888]|uniref:ATP-binding protein n=1 Tax=Saccharothrix sp. ST-888 TaxID=1427391 RepID=UPI0009E304F4